MKKKSEPLRILLIRPGSTDYDEQGRIQGRLDIPLSEAGVEQVSRSAGALKEEGIEVLYASPGQAAEETGRALAQGLDVKMKLIEGMQNLDQGLWQGMLVEHVKAKQPKVYKQWQENPETVCPPEGETLDQARDRVAQMLAKLRRKHKRGVIGLVVPEPLASVVASELRSERPGDLWKPAPCGSWESIAVAAPTPGR